MNGMLIQPVENGFLVTENPPPGANFYRPARYWVFSDFLQVSKFVGDHFAGDNIDTSEPANSIAQVGSGQLGVQSARSS